MGKTMFGIPSVNEKSQRGGAIAPKGTTGGGASGGGNDSAPGSKQQSMGKEAAGTKKASVAKTPMVKPSAPQPSNVQRAAAPAKKDSASKTMFGMPAMNMPAQRVAQTAAKTPAQSGGATAKISSGDLIKKDNAVPAVAKGKAEKEDAFMATMIGVPAVTEEMARVASEKESKEKTDSTAKDISKAIVDNVVTDAAPVEKATDKAALASGEAAVSDPERRRSSSVAKNIEVETQAGQMPLDSKVAPSSVSKSESKSVSQEALNVASSQTSSPVVASSASKATTRRSAGPSVGMLTGLIVGFLLLVSVIVFLAWKFLLS